MFDGLIIDGFFIGLSVAAPIGPINVLCIQRTLKHGPGAGAATAIGCASADATYAAVSALGLASISGFLIGHQTAFQLIGAVVLAWLGLKALRWGPARSGGAVTSGAASHVVSAYALTITNPLTILIFASLFAGIGATLDGADSAGLLIAGVFLGTFTWMSGLIIAASILRARTGQRFIATANKIGAAILLGFAAWLVGSAIIGA